ncbi:hypothetical protein [Arthrobacter sp. H20]|uniref:hypothetical protein n=1 Tax=Arthrobacter sp. H20 TaxID=1267981 RepID=UPI00047B539C|nr:hypothetical protein [Arthrobacter sp. H20]
MKEIDLKLVDAPDTIAAIEAAEAELEATYAKAQQLVERIGTGLAYGVRRAFSGAATEIIIDLRNHEGGAYADALSAGGHNGHLLVDRNLSLRPCVDICADFTALSQIFQARLCSKGLPDWLRNTCSPVV